MRAERILLIDDDRRLLESMRDWLVDQGFQVVAIHQYRSATKAIREKNFDLVLCDLRLDEEDGFAILRKLRQLAIETPFLMMTGYGGPDAAAEAISQGAFDLLTKPIIDQELILAIRRAIDQRSISEENSRLKAELDRRIGREEVLTLDTRMQHIFDMIDNVADARANVLITGENGTGKSLIARTIHRRSNRKNKPFVEVACGALPDNLLESELFGHVAGAFTGASFNKQGKFQAADHGTLFLDEIGTATPALQVKLLRVLQELQFEPVGSNETINVDTRIIFATNERLDKLVAEGRFRQDLYYRINVINIELPALRERVNDIPILAEHFFQAACKDFQRNIEGFAPEAMASLCLYSWPGNIRELENVVQRAVLLCRDNWIQIHHFPESVQSASFGVPKTAPRSQAITGMTLREALEEPERQIILEVLRLKNWNRNETADHLGINRTTLYKKMKRLGLEDIAER